MIRPWQSPEIRLALLGFLFHGAWEFLHSPLYADHSRGVEYVVRTRLHCTGGDVLILLGSFWAASLLFRTRRWLSGNSMAPVFVFVGLGLAYTVWSEWYNTRVALTWQYAAAMPQVLGIGLSPLLQWVLVPVLLVLVIRRSSLIPRGGRDVPHPGS